MILGIISIFAIICFALIIFSIWHYDKDYSVGTNIALIVSVILLLSTIICSCIPSFKPKIITTEQEIVFIQNDCQSNGKIPIFGVVINEDYYFGYCYKTENGYKLAKTKAENFIIIETNETTSKIVTIKKHSSFWQMFFLWDFGWGDEENIIYVPVGTIIKDFNLNGEK